MATIRQLTATLGFDVGRFISGATSAINILERLTAAALRPVSSLLSLQGAVARIESGFAKAIEGEQLQARFGIMIGNAETAKRVMDQVNALAGETSFGTGDLKGVAMQLAQVGVAADQVAPTLRTIAQLSAGDANELSHLSEIYAKALSKGSVDAKTLKQLNIAGAGIYGELANVLGVSRVKLDEMTQHGEIGVSTLQQAFRNLTTGGGRFTDSLEIMRNTTGGALTRMNADFNKIFTSISKAILDAVNLEGLANTFGAASQFVQQQFVPGIKAAIGLLGPIFDFVWGTIADGVGVVYDAVVPAVQFFWAMVTDAWNGIVETFTSTFGSVESISQRFTVNWQMASVMVGQYFQTIAAVFGAIAQIVGTVVSTAIDWIGQLIGWFAALETPVGTVGEIFTFLRDTLMVALLTIEFGFIHWRDVLTYGLLFVGYHVVQFANQIVYFFGTVIPTVVAYVGRNWREMLTDMANYLTTVGGNILRNITSLFQGIWDFIRTRGRSGFRVAFVPLTEGFRSAVQESLQIAPREIGGLERQLGNDLQAVGNNLAGEYSGFVGERFAEAMAPGVAAGAELLTNALSNAPNGIEVNTALDAVHHGTEKKEASHEIKALQLGTAEAISASRRRAGGTNAESAIERNTRQTAANTGRAADELVNIRNRTPLAFDPP